MDKPSGVVVLRDDLSQVVGQREFVTDARELAESLCQKTGKGYVIAKILAAVQVDRYPIKWTDVAEGE